MTDANDNANGNANEPTIEELQERVEALEAVVDPVEIETADGESVSEDLFLGLGLTRRQAIVALGLVAVGASIPAAIVRSIGTVDAQTSNAITGIEQLGTSGDPIGTIHVDDLYQTQDLIDADDLFVDGYQLTLNSTPASPSVGDIRIVED